jgi:hypothetical protein
MKDWINEHLIIDDKLVSKRIRIEWFDNNGYTDIYNDIIDKTSFLDTNTPLTERLYCIYNDINAKTYCPTCNTTLAKFRGFKIGYRYCSVRCSQNSEEVKQTVSANNIARYGVPAFTQTERFKFKSKKTWMAKYGVDNPSKAKEISIKKQNTCILNHGVPWPQQSNEIRNKSIQSNLIKYGTDNPQKSKEIQEKTIATRLNLEFKRFFNDTRLSKYIIPQFSVNDYKGIDFEYEFICKRCNSTFKDVLRGGKIPRCYDCYPIQNTSKVEIEIADFVRTLDPNIVTNIFSVIHPQELDIYSEKHKIAIEYNGLYWHSEINGGKDSKYHLGKTKLCEEKGINLIHISESEWLQYEFIIKNKLRYIFGKELNKLSARKCDIVELDTKESKDFLNQYHIQGYLPSNIKLGLKFENKLVAVMTFGVRKIFKNQGWELTRYATTGSIVGGFSKLLKYFETKYKPDNLVSYALRNWTMINNNVYEQTGFNLISYGVPNYKYIKNSNIYSRLEFQKHKLKDKLESFEPTLTEWENMQLNGYDRIWDSGSLKYQKLYNF